MQKVINAHIRRSFFTSVHTFLKYSNPLRNRTPSHKNEQTRPPTNRFNTTTDSDKMKISGDVSQQKSGNPAPNKKINKTPESPQ